MRSLRINRRTFYYAKFLGEENIVNEAGHLTGEKRKTYGTPKKFRANVSSANGDYFSNSFGLSKDYERAIFTHRTDLDITEDTLVWFDRTPSEGTADYVITRVVDGLHGYFYELQKVNTR